MNNRLAENLASVRMRIEDSARRSGRTGSDITMVAVTKYVSADIAAQLAELGCVNLGESRPQELWRKADQLQISSIGPEINWHLIGHLQRNKVERTLPLVSLIHSADSLRLLKAIDTAASQIKRRQPVLLEVNISGEMAKHGFSPNEIEPLLPDLAALGNIEIRGLMCMASGAADLAQASAEFAKLRELRDRLLCVAPPNIHFHELSMGMSGDFEAAIEQGATMVRIGSALFEGVAA